MPVPMIAPMPSATRLVAVSVRLSEWVSSPDPVLIRSSTDLVAKSLFAICYRFGPPRWGFQRERQWRGAWRARGYVRGVRPRSDRWKRTSPAFAGLLAERGGFEPPLPFRVNTLSRRAP